MSREFDYDQAFSRNIGWVTGREQQTLRNKCVAIAGLGGVGGAHLMTLTRLGIGAFHVADFDTFDVPSSATVTGNCRNVCDGRVVARITFEN